MAPNRDSHAKSHVRKVLACYYNHTYTIHSITKHCQQDRCCQKHAKRKMTEAIQYDQVLGRRSKPDFAQYSNSLRQQAVNSSLGTSVVGLCQACPERVQDCASIERSEREKIDKSDSEREGGNLSATILRPGLLSEQDPLTC